MKIILDEFHLSQFFLAHPTSLLVLSKKLSPILKDSEKERKMRSGCEISHVRLLPDTVQFFPFTFYSDKSFSWSFSFKTSFEKSARLQMF